MESNLSPKAGGHETTVLPVVSVPGGHRDPAARGGGGRSQQGWSSAFGHPWQQQGESLQVTLASDLDPLWYLDRWVSSMLPLN